MNTIINEKYLNAITVAELVNQPIHVCTPDGIILFANKAWCVTYGVSKEDAIGKHIDDVVSLSNYYLSVDSTNMGINDFQVEHFDKPTKHSVVHYVRERGEQTSLLSQTPTFNKVMVTGTPIFDENHQMVCVFTLIQDLTLLAKWRDQMEEEIQKNQLVKSELNRLREANMETSLIGNSKSMTEVKSMISTIASSDANVLIIGESGTGKEVVAKEIFKHSKKNDKPFITVNCAAIPEQLLESELFGHVKGAFTGAVSSKIGLFELAADGTIMLDEIGEFPIHLQPKLLRVLQERKFRRVGGTKEIPFNARVIAATNRDLYQLSQTGEFRLDLYYRLNVFPIKLKPLREHKDDLALLANHFLNIYNEKYEKNKFFTAQAIYALEQYSWPGNTRELENAVERAVVIGNQPAITAEHIHTLMGHESTMETAHINTAVTLKEAVDNLEREMIASALKTYKTTYKAAEALGSSQATIARKAKLLGITEW